MEAEVLKGRKVGPVGLDRVGAPIMENDDGVASLSGLSVMEE